MNAGYTRPHFILPFHHRASLQTGMIGRADTLIARQSARMAAVDSARVIAPCA